MERPIALQERIFERVFRIAEIAKFNKNELVEYEESLKVFRDMNNVINTAELKGEIRGRAEGRAEGERMKALDIARNLKSNGLSIEDIAKFTGLNPEEILKL